MGVKVRWPWQSWRTYRFEIDGRIFIAHSSPIGLDVEWVNCPSEFLPSGFSSRVFIAGATSWWQYQLARLRLGLNPAPSQKHVEAEIRQWLETLDDLEDE